ncbi:UDP-2,3-diacylglucosamine diphosphatase [Aliikangiella maris]|uniref:UDP-2,3-diacylglucosamine hydrolase n=2 Tax=Aliikangiella maris TaxID=3162458 RepID=A0ABV3MRC4_9GAMM
MTPVIHLISDLHLCETQPHLLDLFSHYMQHIAPKCQTLIVLGDLFEVWVGDDHHSDFNQQVIAAFRDFVEHDKKLFIAHGNRDFLLGEQFMVASGAIFIDEPYLCHWNNKSVCLLHGDALCTDDLAYQQFRQMVRNQQWQQNFLSQPLANRLAYAADVRQQSQQQQSEKSMQIMDVNAQAVNDLIQQTQCDWLIHGHTHREGKHQLTINNRPCERIVLSDWGNNGHYLEFTHNQLTSHFFHSD